MKNSFFELEIKRLYLCSTGFVISSLGNFPSRMFRRRIVMKILAIQLQIIINNFQNEIDLIKFESQMKLINDIFKLIIPILKMINRN